VFRGKIQTIHFVGVGGVGMSGIAEVLLDHGFAVTGSDLRSNEYTQRLVAKGALVHVGHDAAHVAGCDVAVFSSAVPRDNVELVAARRDAIPVIPRAEMLAELMRLKDGIAIAGSHGKTTTTSLVATVLRDAGLDPTVVIGGKLNVLGSGAARGLGDFLVAEADESDGSFLHLTPTVAVITNIDPEHLDHYGDLDGVKDAFVAFANRVPFYGMLIACLDHPNVQAILPRVEKRTVTYGFAAQADYRARNPRFEGLSVAFEVHKRGEPLGEFRVRIPGIHNVLNALATIVIADELGVSLDKARDALDGFEGVQRRFTVLGDVNEITVVDDYAHHPEEVRVTIEAAQRAYERRLVVVFQPHRYTRTHHLFAELTRAFNRADVLLLTEVYAAGEEPIPEADSAHLADAIRAHGHRDVTHIRSDQSLLESVLQRLQPGDVVLTLGAGDITRLGPQVVASLQGTDAGD